MIRRTEIKDIAFLADVERAAATGFASIPGLKHLAHSAPMPTAVHEQLLAEGVAYVACDDHQITGFVAASVVNAWLHIEEVSVLPTLQGRGIGRELVGAITAEVRAAGWRGVTLTTYANVPWNRPWYARQGFVVPAPAATPRHLIERLANDALLGLSPPERVGMIHTCHAMGADQGAV